MLTVPEVVSASVEVPLPVCETENDCEGVALALSDFVVDCVADNDMLDEYD